MGRLDGKVAIITGAAKGVGEADARIFAREGATVIMTDVDEAAGQAIADEIGATFVKQDVRSEDGWKALIDDVVKTHGGLKVLVNNAGVVEVGTPESQTYEDYKFIMEVSADGTFLGCKYAIPAMRESGGGSIINMASIASVQGEPYVAAYCAAKGAIEALSRSVAVYCAKGKMNIRCNSIHPSGIVTPMVISMGEKVATAGLGSLEDQGEGAGTSKLGEPNDIANTVLFLASDESKFISGAQIRVDNAMSVVTGTVPE
ncbi:MAG: SDR family oxidoreductase [Sphingomonadales bacterium]